MKIDPSYTLHTVAGEHIILIQDAKENKVLSLNPTAQFLWENLNGKDFTLEEAGKHQAPIIATNSASPRMGMPSCRAFSSLEGPIFSPATT